MTSPTLVGFTSHGSAAAETFSHTLPTGIMKGDWIILLCGCGNGAAGPSMQCGETGLIGYHKFRKRTDAGTPEIKEYALVKIAEGNESGQVVTAGSTADCGRISVGSVWRDVDPYTYIGRNSTESASGAAQTNPDAPSLSAPWGAADTAWLAFAVGDANNAFSGTPNNGSSAAYTSNTLLQGNGATDACAGAWAYTLRNAASEDPTAWTRVIEEWVALTVALRPKQSTKGHARVRRCQVRQATQVSSNNDFTTLTVEGGERTRLLALVTTTSSTITSVTLDPGGLNQALTLVTDGGTTALVSATASQHRWYTTVADVPAGTYTLRVTRSVGTGTAGLHWFEIENTSKSTVNVLDVLNVNGTSNAGSAAGSITGKLKGLVLIGVGGGLQSDSDGTWTPAVAGAGAASYGDSRNSVDNRQCCAFVGRAAAGATAVSIASSNLQGAETISFTAISLEGMPEGNTLLMGA